MEIRVSRWVISEGHKFETKKMIQTPKAFAKNKIECAGEQNKPKMVFNHAKVDS